MKKITKSIIAVSCVLLTSITFSSCNLTGNSSEQPLDSYLNEIREQTKLPSKETLKAIDDKKI